MTKTASADLGCTVSGQDIYEQSVTGIHALGTRLQVGDRVFRYCKAGSGAALTALTPCYDGDTLYEGITAAAALANASEISVAQTAGTSGTAIDSADIAAGGWIYVSLTVPQLYRIKGNRLPDSTNTWIELDNDVTADIADGSTVYIQFSPFRNLIVHSHGRAGLRDKWTWAVPLIAVTESYYFWGQTWGPFFNGQQFYNLQILP